jgi:hypothetical protein
MRISWTKVLGFVALVLGPLMKLLSPVIRDGLKDVLLKLYEKAKSTPNPVDDVFVGFVLDLLQIEHS